MRLFLRFLHQLWIDVYNTAVLFVAPWRLFDVARNTSPVSAMYVGGTAIFVQFVLLSLLAAAIGGPPGMSSEAYMQRVFGAMFRAAFVALLLTLVYLSILLFNRWLNDNEKDLHFSIRMLAPATVVVPVLLWINARVVLEARELSTGSSSQWLHWPVWPLLASRWWWLVLLAMPIVLAWRALRQLHEAETRADRVCSGCGYSLRGITRGRCPECGRRLPRSIDATS